MIKSAHEYSVHSLFDPETKIKYVVPKYQREYNWKRINWEYIINDLDENEQGYFLGSVIVVDQTVDSLQISPLEIIDGQQRLLTISLIYAALYERMRNFGKEKITTTEEELITETQNLKYRLIQKTSPDMLKFEPQIQNNNLNDYIYIMHQIGIKSTALDMPKNFGNRKLSKAFEYFRDTFKVRDYDKIKEFLNRLNQALAVKIEVDSHSDAYRLFQSLNDRGTPLFAADLIKTSLLSKLDQKGLMSLEGAADQWNRIMNNLTDDYIIQERFLRQYINAFKRKNTSIESKKVITKATKSNLIRIYDEDLIPQDPLSLLNDLTYKSEIYSRFIKSEYDEHDELKQSLLDLLHVKASPAYTFLLYLFSEYGGDNTLLLEVTRFLVKWYAIRNLTDSPPTRNLDSIFISLIDKCTSKFKEGKFSSDFIINELKREMPTLDAIKEKLSGDIYDENPDIVRFLLSKVEEKRMTRESFVDLWERNSKGLIFTIEHILPEGKNLPAGWIDMIAHGDKLTAKDIQNEYTHRLGNLTLSAYNSNLSNLSFADKRDRKDKRGNSIGYKNGLFLNEDLKDLDSWSVEQINKRGQCLTNEILSFLAMDGEQ
ncbi:MAG: DUF262 domain-containing HNH endonuclease family protein [Thermoplasmatales archaeon]